ncbi:hypothetical protein HPB50_011695 [Hyalomma asiaticum]|uniref:Uncharacterized protein n=1 Tax=Hyalomma asiaticum TaxID=266040 RepID=A0ACB7SVN8_HYAAI|nr:hypothetical protein HPB50_011695 [Hyalomma asiaticum]
MPAEPRSLHKRSSEHGVVDSNTTGRENSLKEKSAIVEASSRYVPPKREKDDADKTISSAQHTPDAKDDEAVKEGAEENTKESAEHSAKESAEHSGKENDQQGGGDEVAPPDEVPSEGDNERNSGGGEPEPQVADVAPAAEIRKQVPESGTCTLYPESRFAILIGLVCFIWIVVVYFLALPSNQGDRSTDNRDSTRTPLTFPTLVETPVTVAPVTTAETGTRSEVPSNIYLCSTDRCIDEGERLRRQINEEMSPCDNFYRYVCSNWELETPVQDFGQGVSVSADVLLEEAMAVTLGDYILNERNIDVGLARLLYRACLRPTGNSSAFLQKEVFAALPVRAWPYNGSHLKTDDIWDLAGALVRRYGIVSILDVTIGVQRGHTGRTIELSYPRHLFVKEDYANAEVLETLRSAVVEAAKEFGWSSEVSSLTSQIISVAQSLADIVDDSSSWEVLVWKFDEFIDSNRDIGTFLRYSVAQQAVYLPVGIVGGSLPDNSTLPVYHASRTAVRLYLGLLPLLYERWDSNEYAEALEVLTGRSANRLAQLLDCLEADWLAMSYEWRLSAVDVELRAAEARYPILAQSAALALAYAAFKELLSVERVWKVDFRLQPLADVTSEQLFFLYYAFDNCERSDKPYRSRQFRAWQRLPPEHRVNMPLRHLPQFAQAFRCNASDGRRTKKAMVAPDESRCDTVRWNMSPSPSSIMRLEQRAGLNSDVPSEFLGGIVDVPSTTVASGNDTSLRGYGTTAAIS